MVDQQKRKKDFDRKSRGRTSILKNFVLRNDLLKDIKAVQKFDDKLSQSDTSENDKTCSSPKSSVFEM